LSSKYLAAGVAGDGNSKIVEFLYKKNFCIYESYYASKEKDMYTKAQKCTYSIKNMGGSASFAVTFECLLHLATK
jgi:hypothetical protein